LNLGAGVHFGVGVGNFDLLSLSINGVSINNFVDEWAVDQ
jgi:hypothetical protein